MTADQPHMPAARVAYLVSQYPALSHTFIETEVEALRRLGVEVDTFSVRPPGTMLSDRSRSEHRRTVVLQDRTAVLRALGALLARSPVALGKALVTALRSGPASPKGRVWQLFYLLEGLVLWQAMRRRGLRRVHVHFANNGADIARLAVAVGRAVDGPDAGWTWSLTMHGSTEFDDRVQHDLPAKFRSADFTACISDFTRGQVMRDLDPADWDKAVLVRMGVDTSRFRPPAEPRRRAPGEALRILTVGRLVAVKGTPVLVAAVEDLIARGVPVHLVVAGGGELLEALRELVDRRGLGDAVELLGPVSPDLLPDMYRSVDVFCLPSFAEGLPVVLMEAMASGLPVVSTIINGIPELVLDRRTGLLVVSGRADRLADALQELHADADLGRRLGENGRDAVLQDHEPEVSARALLELFRRYERPAGEPSSRTGRRDPGPS